MVLYGIVRVLMGVEKLTDNVNVDYINKWLIENGKKLEEEYQRRCMTQADIHFLQNKVRDVLKSSSKMSRETKIVIGLIMFAIIIILCLAIWYISNQDNHNRIKESENTEGY